MPSYFVTATGTDIGKTYASAQILRAAREAGMATSACKPLMSGFGEDDLVASDAGQLLNAMGRDASPDNVSKICLHRFEQPIAPNVAMRRAGMAQDYSEILSFARNSQPNNTADKTAGLHLIEGAGGLMSPVTDEKLHSDMILDLGLPVVLVTAGYLGAVSHTLTALAWCRSANVKVAMMIVSQPAQDAEDPAHLMAEVARWSDVPARALPFGAQAHEIADLLAC